MISTDVLQRILFQAQMHGHVRMPGDKLAAILTELLEYRRRDAKIKSNTPDFIHDLLKGIKP